MKKWIIGGTIVFITFIGIYLYVHHLNTLKQEEIAKALYLEEQALLEKELAERRLLFSRIKIKADSAKMYCEKNGLRTDYCYLVDFKIHSGKNRFFVWDFENDTISDSGLCCHGYGDKNNRSTPSKPVLSNEVGSLCSSLGHYKIAYRDVCSYGTLFQYRLHGLDMTNNNALQRAITLHSYRLVPDEEIYPQHIPLGYSQGCLIVSDSMLYRLDNMLINSVKPLLIWAYYN